MRALLFGDGEWAGRALDLLVDGGHDVPAVVVRCRPSSDALAAAAARHGLPVHAPENVNDPAFIEWIVAQDVRLNISVSYDQILRAAALASVPEGFINAHAGALPRYRGRSVINWALINGEDELGLTVHHVDEGIDTGDVILQRMVPIGWEDTYGTVLSRTELLLPELVLEAVDLLARGQAPRVPQDHHRATYFPARGPGDEWIDWRDSSEDVYNKIRGLGRPGPGARTIHRGRELVLWEARYDRSWPRYRATPGAVVGVVPGEGIRVKTGDSTILLTRTSALEGAEEVPRLRIGTRLGIDARAQAQESAS